MTWTYRVTTGDLFHDGALVGRGYSGQPPHTNIPEAEGLASLGPLPRGAWYVSGAPYDSPLLGPFVLPLTARPGTDTKGRSAFRIHGDSKTHPGYASHGCIVVPRSCRQAIYDSRDPDILVVT